MLSSWWPYCSENQLLPSRIRHPEIRCANWWFRTNQNPSELATIESQRRQKATSAFVEIVGRDGLFDNTAEGVCVWGGGCSV